MPQLRRPTGTGPRATCEPAACQCFFHGFFLDMTPSRHLRLDDHAPGHWQRSRFLGRHLLLRSDEPNATSGMPPMKAAHRNWTSRRPGHESPSQALGASSASQFPCASRGECVLSYRGRPSLGVLVARLFRTAPASSGWGGLDGALGRGQHQHQHQHEHQLGIGHSRTSIG